MSDLESSIRDNLLQLESLLQKNGFKSFDWIPIGKPTRSFRCYAAAEPDSEQPDRTLYILKYLSGQEINLGRAGVTANIRMDREVIRKKPVFDLPVQPDSLDKLAEVQSALNALINPDTTNLHVQLPFATSNAKSARR